MALSRRETWIEAELDRILCQIDSTLARNANARTRVGRICENVVIRVPSAARLAKAGRGA